MRPAQSAAPDRPWRIWASVIIISVLAFSVLFGFIVIPVVQGHSAGIDPFTAICRAIGIAPGSPAVRQPTSDAKAQPTTTVAWSTGLFSKLSQPTPAGAAVAAGCAGCHGERGIAPNRQFPDLAGQSAVAIYKELHDFKSGSRVNPIMSAMVQSLSEEQIVEVSTYFAAGTSRIVEASSAPVPDEDALRLVERGDPARGLPACNACHGSNSGGPIEAPALSRQSNEYLASQLRAFKSGARRNDIYTRMRSVTAKLTEREVDVLADFYSNTPNY
jgi:cytochrome c553